MCVDVIQREALGEDRLIDRRERERGVKRERKTEG